MSVFEFMHKHLDLVVSDDWFVGLVQDQLDMRSCRICESAIPEHIM